MVPTEHCSDQEMRIGCWNVNSLRARLPLVSLWIQKANPHIMLFQETKVQDSQFPVDFFDAHYYNVVFSGQKSYNGVAIASKFPVEDCKPIFFPAAPEEARCIEATIQGMRFLSIYVPNGKDIEHPDYQKKLSFLDQLYDYVAPFATSLEGTLLGGDFNIAPTDQDVYDARIWKDKILCSVAERQKIRRMVHNGWVFDVDPQEEQKNPSTWWDYRHQAIMKDHGLRIDYFLLSAMAKDRQTSFTVEKSLRLSPQTSDHAPLMVTLSLG